MSLRGSYEPKPPPIRGYIYFFEPIGKPDIFKIGFATDVNRRLKTIQTACPFKLMVSCEVPGTVADEHRLHRLLASHRIYGEWFDGNETRWWMWAIQATESTDEAVIVPWISRSKLEIAEACSNSTIRSSASAGGEA